jgi:hypothetical protein
MRAFWDIAPCGLEVIRAMMEALCTFEMSVHFNRTTWCHIPEGSQHHTHWYENLKSYNFLQCHNKAKYFWPTVKWLLWVKFFSYSNNLQIPHHQCQLQHQLSCQSQMIQCQGHAYMQPCPLMVWILLILVQLVEGELSLALLAVLMLTVQSMPNI